ncbi:hypothetical protein ABPG75_004370 [Micractinium tetrahymenae]
MQSTIMRSLPLLLAALLVARAALAEEQAAVLPVHGKLFVPDGASLAQAEVALQLESGRRLLAFPLPDGAFSFAEVPVGVHTLTADVHGLIYPTVRLDVGTARKGKVAAVAADATGMPALPYPLLLRPYSRIEYFEKRQPFSLWAFLKTPYGMMAGFMLFSVFIMPKLKVDPEEYREMMADRERERSGGSGGGGQKRRSD